MAGLLHTAISTDCLIYACRDIVLYTFFFWHLVRISRKEMTILGYHDIMCIKINRNLNEDFY